jgi:cbb3-type cytochrome oxidase maturation protein
MNVLVFLIPVSLILGGLGLAAFLWTLRSNQYDDLEGDAWRILSEDDKAPDDKDEPRV